MSSIENQTISILGRSDMAENFSEAQLSSLLNTLHKVYGYDFTDYAPSTVIRRSMHFMHNRRIADILELEEVLASDETTFEQFIQTISITVTEMFRDPSFYKFLRSLVLKRLATYPFIKIWIAGCATGEEVYSIAIALYEEGLLHRSLIYATDINVHSLSHAREGFFPAANIETYTDNYYKHGGVKKFSEYYTVKNDRAVLAPSLRENVIFSSHNLVTDQSFNEFQLILCRNVLIYFKQQLQDRVIDLFYDSLCPFGFLALGSKESLLFSRKKSCFNEIEKMEKIFQKVR